MKQRYKIIPRALANLHESKGVFFVVYKVPMLMFL